MAKNKARLGRGLSSLLGMGEEAPAEAAVIDERRAGSTPTTEQSEGGSTPGEGVSADRLFHVELSAVSVNPHQPRREFDDDSLRQLAESLKTSGLIQPILVRADGFGFQLIAGERRFRAAKLAGFVRLPAVLRVTDEIEQAQLALIENIHREDLNPIERATAYRSLMTHLGLTQEELATRLNEERSSIANYLRLLDLVTPVRELVGRGRLSMGHAKLLAGVHDVLEQQRLADRVVAEQLSVRALEQLLQAPAEDRRTKTRPGAGTAHIADLERRLSRDLQMRCQVQRVGLKGRGKLVIHYASLDQFDHLLGRLGVSSDEA